MRWNYDENPWPQTPLWLVICWAAAIGLTITAGLWLPVFEAWLRAIEAAK